MGEARLKVSTAGVVRFWGSTAGDAKVLGFQQRVSQGLGVP